MSIPRSWLYVPGHRPDRVRKALASAADAVVVDLEDAVPVAAKDEARRSTVALLQDRPPDSPPIWVRVNPPTGRIGRADVEALAGMQLDGLRVPRCEDPDAVQALADQTGHALMLLLETARGLMRASELASAHTQVRGLGLGEADLAADLMVRSDSGLEWARGAVVAACRAAGLPSPVQSVWTDVSDIDGLRASCQAGLARGFFGRSVVHPSQIEVVHEVYTPSAHEVADARAVLATGAEARARGEVAALDDQGRFVDPAVEARARVVLDRIPVERGVDRDGKGDS
ncbi:MAG TPA: CoA ester lyase [Lapillicoccus sp.]|nr:CoA ester lyase [Lapillicoccus sp.]